jgi:hypothetical protein
LGIVVEGVVACRSFPAESKWVVVDIVPFEEGDCSGADGPTFRRPAKDDKERLSARGTWLLRVRNMRQETRTTTGNFGRNDDADADADDDDE